MKILLLLSCILTLQSNDNLVTPNPLKHYSTGNKDSNPKKCHVDTDQQLPTSLCNSIPLVNPQQIINSMFTFNGNEYSKPTYRYLSKLFKKYNKKIFDYGFIILCSERRINLLISTLFTVFTRPPVVLHPSAERTRTGNKVQRANMAKDGVRHLFIKMPQRSQSRSPGRTLRVEPTPEAF